MIDLPTYTAFFPWKSLLYPDHLKRCVSGSFLSPITLHIYPTNVCNNSCSWCIMSNEQEKHPVSLDANIFERVIQEAQDWGVKAIHIAGGGEPTLYTFLDKINYFKGKKILSTNGYNLKPHIAALFDRIRISVNAGSAETFNEVCGGTNVEWDALQRTIFDLMHRDRHSEVGLGYVVGVTQTAEDIMLCIDMAYQFGCDFIHIRPAWYPKRDIDRIESDSADEYSVSGDLRDKIELAQAYGMKYRNSKLYIHCSYEKFEGDWTERQYSKCRATPLQAVVTADARMIVCQDMFHKFGDLTKQSMQDIWGSAEHLAAIGRIDLDKCPRCVMGKPNEIIEHITINNEIMGELL